MGYSMTESGFDIITGTNNILLVAPHGYQSTDYKDDENTAELTVLLAEKLQCYAVINTVYRKPRIDDEKEYDIENKIVNLNDLRQYGDTQLYDEFVGPIVDVANKYRKQGKPLFVFHIHGIGDENIDGDLGILLGLGLGKTDKDNSLSVPLVFSETLIKRLNDAGLLSKTTRHGDYAAKAGHNLNQLFRKHLNIELGVYSVQLELKYSGYRDVDSLMATAEKLANAMRAVTGTGQLIVNNAAIEQQSDNILVDTAHSELSDIFVKHYQNALLEAGQYIIDTFYAGEIELARQKTPVKVFSYNQLKECLQNSDASSPKKSWLYNAVNLAIQEHDLATFQALGKLTTSHKLLLLPERDLELKERLARETIENGYTTRQLAERIKVIRAKQPTLRSSIRKPDELFSKEYSHLYSQKSLSEISPAKLAIIRTNIQKEVDKRKRLINEQQQYIKRYQKLLKTVENMKKD